MGAQLLLGCVGCVSERELPTTPSAESSATVASAGTNDAAPGALDGTGRADPRLDTEPAPPAPAARAACSTLGGFTLAETASCYMLGDNVFTWQDARSFCQAWGGDLVEIGSARENAALARRSEASAWIGASDQIEEGTFRWAGGAPLGYAPWSQGQPNDLGGNEDCTELRASDEQWSDVPCAGDMTRRALCERP